MESTKNKLIAICKLIEKMKKQGASLKDISKWSYLQRESGEDIPYFSKSEDYLVPMPTSKQPEFKKFFTELAPGAVSITKYVLRIYADDIEFFERINKNPDGKGWIKKHII